MQQIYAVWQKVLGIVTLLYLNKISKFDRVVAPRLLHNLRKRWIFK